MGTTEVAVTGLGASTPLGGDMATTWEAMLAGRSGASSSPWSAHARRGPMPGAPPAIRNLDRPDPEIKLDLVRGNRRRGGWDAALANSFGFGGHNVSLAFTRA